MNRCISLWRIGVLALGLAFAGCDSAPPPSRGEATFEELNIALARIEASGHSLPDSVEQLVMLPELQGKTLPELPAGFHLSIDPESRRVTVQPD